MGGYIKNRVALVFHAYQPNKAASELLEVALKSALKFKFKDVDIWVSDLGSPASKHKITNRNFTEVNFLESDYIPRSWENLTGWKVSLAKFLKFPPPRHGAYAAGCTMDFAIQKFRELNYKPEFILCLHMDIMFTSNESIDVLRNKLQQNHQLCAAGYMEQLNYSKKYKTLSPTGCMWRSKFVFEQHFSFKPNFPDFDMGEWAIQHCCEKGYQIASLKNSYSHPEIINDLPLRFRELNNVDRAIDKNGNVMFIHLGRGLPKAMGRYKAKGKTRPERWRNWFDRHLL